MRPRFRSKASEREAVAALNAGGARVGFAIGQLSTDLPQVVIPSTHKIVPGLCRGVDTYDDCVVRLPVAQHLLLQHGVGQGLGREDHRQHGLVASDLAAAMRCTLVEVEHVEARRVSRKRAEVSLATLIVHDEGRRLHVAKQAKEHHK